MKGKIVAIWAAIKADAIDTWQRSKFFLLGLAALLLALEFQKLKEFLLLYFGQKEMKDTERKDQDLANKENSENAQADALIKQAQDLPKQEQPIDDNWYKK